MPNKMSNIRFSLISKDYFFETQKYTTCTYIPDIYNEFMGKTSFQDAQLTHEWWRNAGIFFGESSRVVPQLHLTPFSKFKVQNFKNPCFWPLSVTSVIGMKYLYVDRALLWTSCQSGNCCPISMIFTPLESSVQSRWRMSHFQRSGNHFTQR